MKPVVFCLCLLALPRGSALADDITPRVRSIEIYGNRKVSSHRIDSALKIKVGDIPPSREDAEDRIDKISGVLTSRVQAACCEGGGLTVYVGVEERDAPHIEFHPEPTGNPRLPDDLVETYRAFIESVAESIRDDAATQDLTNGYSLMQGARANELQNRFLALAARDLPLLDQVIRNSADPEQRTTAAYVLQYAPRGPRTTPVMVNALQWALQDSDDGVRQNAMRALKAVMVGARLHPDQHIHLQPTWFVELLNSPVLTDRRDASLALVEMTEKRDSETLRLIRERALPSVLESAKWQDLKYALPPFILAGRVAELNEDQIRQAWLSGDREAVIAQALSPKRKFHITSKNNKT